MVSTEQVVLDVFLFYIRVLISFIRGYFSSQGLKTIFW